MTARSCNQSWVQRGERKKIGVKMKVQITYDYTDANTERKGYNEMDYLGSIAEDNFEEDIANLVVAWLKYRDLCNGTTHNCEYDVLGNELYFEEFKGDEKVGTLAEVEIEIPSKQVIFKL